MRLVSVAAVAWFIVSLPISGEDHPGHAMLMGSELEWASGPASLPAGSEMTVLSGNPSREGVFTMRLRLPADYRIPPHWHPAIEHVTVIEGRFSMGLGDQWDDAALREHGPGDFMVMQPGTRHFAASSSGATIQLHGIGPWQIHYVNPEDDPRN
jgi:quercetin dioxygenase-like cupin family protein